MSDSEEGDDAKVASIKTTTAVEDTSNMRFITGMPFFVNVCALVVIIVRRPIASWGWPIAVLLV